MSKKRLLSGIVLIITVVLIIMYLPPLLQVVVISCLNTWAMVEFLRMLDAVNIPVFRPVGIFFALFLPFLCFYTDPLDMGFTILLVLIIVYLVGLIRSKQLNSSIVCVSVTLFAILYIPLFLSHMVWFLVLKDGKLWIYSLLMITYFTDMSAYYFGTLLGKHKLAIHISPNKSIEGFLFGILGGLLGGAVSWGAFFRSSPLMLFVIIGVVMGVVGQLGDLFESIIKRNAGIKDTGTIIPGHGGLLDRIDSLLFTTPVFFYFVKFMMV